MHVRFVFVASALLVTSLFAWTSAQAQPSDSKVLVFSKTAGWRHASIPNGKEMLMELGVKEGLDVDTTEDAGRFTDAILAQYDAVVFLMTSGEILDKQQQAAFERYIQGGGSYVGIHSASDTEYEWPWYGRLVGTYFADHPEIQPAVVLAEDVAHPSTEMLPERWQRTDEWYNFQENPRGDVHVLLTLDEGTYEGGTLGADHPIAWCHAYDGGRAWYTGGGHTSESYTEPLFRQHVLGGLLWAIGAAEGGCSAASK